MVQNSFVNSGIYLLYPLDIENYIIYYSKLLLCHPGSLGPNSNSMRNLWLIYLYSLLLGLNYPFHFLPVDSAFFLAYVFSELLRICFGARFDTEIMYMKHFLNYNCKCTYIRR